MLLSQVLPKLILGKSNLTDFALCDVESIDSLEMYGEDSRRTELLPAVTADVALLIKLMLTDRLGAQITIKLPQTWNSP